MLRNSRSFVQLLLVRERQQIIDLLRIEAGEIEIEVRGVDLLQLEAQKTFVPLRPLDRTIHQEPERLHLCRRPLVAQDHGDFGNAELTRRLQAEMAIDDLAVTAGEHGNLETELANARAHALDSRIVLARIARVESQPVDRPLLDWLRRYVRNHSTPHQDN